VPKLGDRDGGGNTALKAVSGKSTKGETGSASEKSQVKEEVE